MQKVNIEIADNGVVKKIIDDNINSAGEQFESNTVYTFDGTESKIEFIKEFCVDIGLSLGNTKSKQKIQIKPDWGDNYSPNPDEINQKIKSLQDEIKRLQSIL